MDLLALLNHAINLFAPALWLAVLLPLLARVDKRRARWSLMAQMAVIFAAGSVTLGIALVLLGADGRMLTYLTLVLVCASSQFWMLRR